MATINILSGKNNLASNKKDVNIQSVPFKIHADCDANVKKYFDVYIKNGERDVLKTSFRGYPLQGKKVEVPEGYAGVVLHESVRLASNKERRLHVIGHFSELTFWNWDKIPSANDTIRQALQWIDVAEALHSPVLEE